MDYLSYFNLHEEFLDLIKDIEQGTTNKSPKNENEIQQTNDSKEKERLKFTEIIVFLNNIKNGKVKSEYFSEMDFAPITKDEFNLLSEEKKIGKIQEVHKKIAQVYIMLAHYANRDAHSGGKFSQKDVFMANYITHAMLGKCKAQILIDKTGLYYLNTPIKLILDNKDKEILPHFGNRSNYIKNFNTIIEQAYELLFTYVPKDNKSKEVFFKDCIDYVMLLETCNLNKRANFRPLIKFLIHFPNDIEQIKEIFMKQSDPKIDKDSIELMDNFSFMINRLQQAQVGTNSEKMENIEELINDYVRTRNLDSSTISVKETVKLLNLIGYKYTEDEISILIEKKRRKIYDNYRKSNGSRREIIDFIKTNSNNLDTILTIENAWGEYEELGGLLQIVHNIKDSNQETDREQLEKLLIYRCVGIGIEEEDAFFQTEEGEEIPIKQISDFVKSQGIKIPDLDTKIEEAYTEKELLQSEGWNLGKEPLTQRRFVEILKDGMIAHNMDFNHIDEAIEYYRKLDMLYGRDTEQSIETIKGKIGRVLSEKEPENYEEIKQQYDVLYDDALEGRIPEFFEKLPLTFTPEEAAEYYEQSDEFDAMYYKDTQLRDEDKLI